MGLDGFGWVWFDLDWLGWVGWVGLGLVGFGLAWLGLDSLRLCLVGFGLG